MTNRELAEKIVERLFDNSHPIEGLKPVRLQVKLGEYNFIPVSMERDGGGWCFGAAVDCIEEVLNKELDPYEVEKR